MPSQLICVDPKQVHDFWPHVSDLLRRANERCDASDWHDDIDRIMSGDALLWLAWDGQHVAAAATTELHEFNGHKHCYVTGCGGDDRTNWLHLIGGIEQYAKREGCKSVRTLGREGWKRVLKDYAPKLVLLEKELA